MTIRKVALMGSPILSRIAKPVEDPTAPEIAQLVEDMRDTLADLDGILYPMRMEDLSRLEFNTEPGFLAQDVAEGMKVWPVLQDMVNAWPERNG